MRGATRLVLLCCTLRSRYVWRLNRVAKVGIKQHLGGEVRFSSKASSQRNARSEINKRAEREGDSQGGFVLSLRRLAGIQVRVSARGGKSIVEGSRKKLGDQLTDCLFCRWATTGRVNESVIDGRRCVFGGRPGGNA
jgi:hypothetical protein